jgi:putative flippase GtrA
MVQLTRLLVVLRFGVSGTVAALGYFGIAIVGVRTFRLAPEWAGFAGYIGSLPIAFLLHRVFTFRSRARFAPEWLRFLCSSLLGCLLSSWLPAAAMDAGVSLHAALGLTCIIVPSVNYLLLSRWAFVARECHG